MHMKLLLITVSFLEPVQPLTWQKSGKVLDQNYEIFTRKDKNTHKNYLQYSSYERGYESNSETLIAETLCT